MLSIIISSYLPRYFAALEKSIAETCGLQYEIIKIDNPGLMGICKAYNLGAENAKYENLLFIHEDVIFLTKNWGEKLIAHIAKKNTGIIGIAGSSYVPHAPSSWTVTKKHNFINILQGNKNNSEASRQNTTLADRNKVFAVDGVFLALKKENFLSFKFNEDLKGFHGYDLDISLRISKKFQNYVINDILIQHFSSGNLNQLWFDTNVKIRQALGASFNTEFDSEIEKNSFLGFLSGYFKYYPVSKKSILFTLNFYPYRKIKFIDHFIILKKYYHYFKYASDINKN
ncbi:MAG TPA: glycosyltransferase [Chryseobacterium sp.]